QRGMAAVRRDHQVGGYRTAPRLYPGDALAGEDKAGRLGLQAQLEAAVGARGAREKIEEIPLRDHGDERKARADAPKVDERELPAAEGGAELAHLGVGKAEEIVGEAELVQDLKRGRVDRVAAEVTQEVGMLLEHGGSQ